MAWHWKKDPNASDYTLLIENPGLSIVLFLGCERSPHPIRFNICIVFKDLCNCTKDHIVTLHTIIDLVYHDES